MGREIEVVEPDEFDLWAIQEIMNDPCDEYIEAEVLYKELGLFEEVYNGESGTTN